MSNVAMSAKSFGVLGSGISASRDLIQNEVWAISLLLRGSAPVLRDELRGAFRKTTFEIKNFGQNLSLRFREALTRNELVGTVPSLVVGACPCGPCAVGVSFVSIVTTSLYYIKKGKISRSSEG